MVGNLPADVGLVLLVVPGVARVHRLLEGLEEAVEVLRQDGGLERRPVVPQVLLDGGLVLGPRIGAGLEQLLGLFPLVQGVGPVALLHGLGRSKSRLRAVPWDDRRL